MFGNDRQKMRQFFHDAWQKKQQGQPLQPLETIVTDVIQEHPEYHGLLVDASASEKDYTPEHGETNPFLHMGMHISLAEQLATDRPPGIRSLYQKIVTKTGTPHQAEHQIMECLGLILWEAQRDSRAPDETAYLACLKRLAA